MKTILWLLLVVSLVWFNARVVWANEAYRVQESIRQVVASGDSYKSIDAAMAAVEVQLQKARTLNHTCVYVAECSPRQVQNADVVIDDEYKRIAKTKQFFKIYDSAKKAFEAGDQPTLSEMKPQYEQAKDDMGNSNLAVKTDIENFNLQSQIKAILAETI